ncbi:hypothetical protein OAQ85_03535 [Schleiferiaceae bacterium]|nr:hypothetical protein [Schleiferiaceae bacterium]
MKHSLTIVLLAYCLNLTAQSITDLDKRNGFKDFKIGDSYEKWKNSTELLNNSSNGTKSYLYTGSCCGQVFDEDVESTELIFDKANKLVGIGIRLKSFRVSNKKSNPEGGKYVYFDPELSDYKDLRNSFTMLFGNGIETLDPKPSDKSPIAMSSWIGENISLTLNYWYTGLLGEDWCAILVSDNSYQSTKIQSGF